MNLALLFNSDYPDLGSWYGFPVMDRILQTRVLQNASRHMRVSIGDILTYSAVANSTTFTLGKLDKLCHSVYKPTVFDRLVYDRLTPLYATATIYCWMFQNATYKIGQQLHDQLLNEPYYVGAMDVNFSDRLHLHFFRNLLVETFRLNGLSCNILYVMSENEDPDLSLQQALEIAGFHVDYEDVGARRTIFDSYDSFEHFKRLEDFKRVFGSLEGFSDEKASDIALMLEELHPKMFDTLASAARALERAETNEDYAQVALSGRRLLEQTADYLFPARTSLWNDRKVGQAEYRNRLWAYIEDTTNQLRMIDKAKPIKLGKEADRLAELFNKGLHKSSSKQNVSSALCDMMVWLKDVIELSPAHARRPYLAYEEEIKRFFISAHNRHFAKNDLEDN